MTELDRPTLFRTPELLRTTYPVNEVSGHTFTVGEVLLAVPSRTPGRVDLAHGTRHVGFLDGQPGQSLRSALSGRDGGGGVHVEVVSKCDLSGVAQVRIRSEGKAA